MARNKESNSATKMPQKKPGQTPPDEFEYEIISDRGKQSADKLKIMRSSGPR